jgi:hypothetical protein
VGMWESRVLGEISKARWKPFCGFHGADISTAVCAIAPHRADPRERDRVGPPQARRSSPGEGFGYPWKTPGDGHANG